MAGQRAEQEAFDRLKAELGHTFAAPESSYVSLTAAEVDGNRCMVSIIPHTYEVTTFNRLHQGDLVNVEFDMIGKYIRNFADR